MNHECFLCSAKFEINFEDEDFKAVFCPSCGQQLITDIQILDEMAEDMLYDDDEV